MELGTIADQSSSYSNRTDQRTGYRTNRSSNQHSQLTPENKQQLIQDGKCFYCREPGHMARDCPRRQHDMNH
jgi:hypothetical protein